VNANGLSKPLYQDVLFGEALGSNPRVQESHNVFGEARKRRSGCFRCGEHSHWAVSCHNSILCYNCHKFGHRAAKCSVEMEQASMEGSSWVLLRASKEMRQNENKLKKCIIVMVRRWRISTHNL
jgi:hypothetical protein